MLYKLNETITLVTQSCYKCGVVFAMPEQLQNTCERDGDTFYCPNGHGQVYTSNIKQELENTKRKLSQKEFELMAERNLHLATQRKMKRLEKRISKGVCPCCHRQFVNMTRHMKGQHPEYGLEENTA
jgi:hypothetical protein